ncbi:protein CHUP1, chloroplastic-like isoform X2 [Zingiber officinale]|uniref:protein CHUP1, chloroplastic-like isoform X2 n=1 Tax=Zingiber officinale TaxID=94328 RepID=UPI001C4D9B20|nr:protein CHUP1, chloroplastic-like isoform X2 [Zingiber officinale]XP_042452071.1 protein CHUP1, chloroplastic-like isoform X2 [Zingiber officinale]
MMPNPSAFTNLSLLSHFADRDCATHISLPCSYNFEAAVVDPSKVMKQELQSRARVVSRSTKDSPRAEADKGSPPMLKPRPKPTDVYTNSSTSLNLAKRSLHFNKLRPGTNKAKELESRLDESERMVVELHKEVAGLKAEVDKLKVRNVELESENKRLHQHLVAAEAKNINKSIVLELVQQNSKNAKELEIHGSNTCKSHSLAQVQPKLVNKMPIPSILTSKALPPPPPPPPPHNDLGRIAVSKPSALVQLYHSLNKRDGKQGSLSNGCSSSLSSNVHSGIVGELQHRSAHLLAIKADVETKGQLIKHLIEKVQSSSFSNMEDVLSFVDWLDGQLSTLADERAVLKHFDWPEKKADALREAAVEFRDLKQLEAQVSSLKDDPSLPCETTLKKISNLLDKLERGVDQVIKLRNSNMVLYREFKIPTDWLLDSGMVCKMKQLSVKLARCYLSRVSIELESFRESAQEALLFQGVRFAYRAHQFAGGLDSELMITIEELKKKVELQGTTK